LRVYFAFLLLTGVVGGVSLLPNVALVASIWTFGLALIVMMGAITLFFYLLALAPAVLRGGRKGAVLSAVLVAAVALGPNLVGRGLIAQAEGRIMAGDVAPEAPLAAPVRVVALQTERRGLEATLDPLAMSLLRGEMVTSVHLLDDAGTVIGHIRDGAVPAVILGPDSHGPAQVTIRRGSQTGQSVLDGWEEWALASRGLRQVTVHEGEGFAGPVLLRETVVALSPPAIPTIFMPRMDGLVSGGNDGGFYPMPRRDQTKLDDESLVRAAISRLGIPLGDAAAARAFAGQTNYSSPDRLAALRITAGSALDRGAPLNDDAERVVMNWISALRRHAASTAEEDVALMEQALQAISPSAADHAGFAIAENGVLWRTYRDRYAEAMSEGAGLLPQRTRNAITLRVARRGVSDADTEALRPAMAQAVARMQAKQPSRYQIRTLLAAARVGVDARPELEVIRLIGLHHDTQTEVMEALRYGICAFPPEERRRLAPATAPALGDMLAPWREEARSRPLTRNLREWLHFLLENGGETEMRAMLAELPAEIGKPAAAEIATLRPACR